MSIVWINAILWPLAALLAVPLLIHLFARSKPPVYRFSSVEFILRVLRSTLRVRKPQDWILLLVRTLLVAALVLLFLRPLYFASRHLASPFERKNVVVIVDATASMACTDGAQNRFAAACGEASEILSGLTTRDTANLIWLKAVPESVFPEMGVNLSFLQDALRRARVTSEAGNMPDAFRMAARLLENAEGKREVYVVSDFQKSAWQNELPAMPAGIALARVPVGTAEVANGALTDLRIDPPAPLAGEDVTVYADVSNFSGQPMRRTVFLAAGESRQSQDLVIPAWGRSAVAFRQKFAGPGTYVVSASISEDPFAGDDRRWSIVTVREFLRAGLLSASPATAATWRRALNALGWVRAEAVTPHDLESGAAFDVLFLAGWDGGAPAALKAALQAGCPLIVYPAAGRSIADIAALAPPAAGATNRAEAFRWEEGEIARPLKVTAAQDPVFTLFAGGEYGDIARGTFKGRLIVPAASLPAGSATLLAYDDGIPALVRLQAPAPLYLWNLSLDPRLSTWPARPEFVTFLGELLLHSRRTDAGRQDRPDLLPGEPTLLQTAGTGLASDYRLRREDASEVAVRDMGGTAVAATLSLEPGLYTWERQGKPLLQQVVNFPTVESDLRLMRGQDPGQKGAVTLSGGSRAKQMREGVHLWPYLLALAVVFVVMESGLMVWIERK